MSTIRPIFIDMQGFIVREKFVIKEIFIFEGDGRNLIHYIFLPPMAWNQLTKAKKSRASWLILHQHKLSWCSGDVEYRRAKNIIRHAIHHTLHNDNLYSVIYVKRSEKQQWLHKIIGNILNEINVVIKSLDVEYKDINRLENMDNNLKFRCGRHERHCAMENVYKLYNWWSKNTET